jgi:hypothetical protein
MDHKAWFIATKRSAFVGGTRPTLILPSGYSRTVPDTLCHPLPTAAATGFIRCIRTTSYCIKAHSQTPAPRAAFGPFLAVPPFFKRRAQIG